MAPLNRPLLPAPSNGFTCQRRAGRCWRPFVWCARQMQKGMADLAPRRVDAGEQ